MEKAPYSKHTKELRLEAVRRVTEEGLSAENVAIRHSHNAVKNPVSLDDLVVKTVEPIRPNGKFRGIIKFKREDFTLLTNQFVDFMTLSLSWYRMFFKKKDFILYNNDFY